MPIGDVPILEILLRQLAAHGVRDVTVLSGHLAYMIEGYVGDGASMGLRVDYVHESAPLGTAGPLRQLRGRFDDDFLVMNGDLLTDVDFGALMDRHRAAGAIATVGVYRRDERIELGVLKLGDEDDVVGYDEKPVLHFDVSMGLYGMSPSILELIPDHAYDMPTLIVDALGAGHRVTGYRHAGFWLDIGRPDDYEEASRRFELDPSAFLPRAEST